MTELQKVETKSIAYRIGGVIWTMGAVAAIGTIIAALAFGGMYGCGALIWVFRKGAGL